MVFAVLFCCCGFSPGTPSGDAQSGRANRSDEKSPGEPVRLIFDTDMGNDVDDALALGVIHALSDRGECRLVAVTLSKDNPLAVNVCELINAFYGRAEIPVGRVRGGKTPEDGRFLRPVMEVHNSGRSGISHRIRTEAEMPDATGLLRQVLAEQPDDSVVMVVVGFSTNMARLLDSRGDAHSPLDGRALVDRKVQLLSMMGGHFGRNRPDGFREYNIRIDLPSAQRVFEAWPTPIVISGYEIGEAIRFPAACIQHDFNYAGFHPLKVAYEHYDQMPYDRPTWDLTSVLEAVRPGRGYFGRSAAGRLSVGSAGCAAFTPDDRGQHWHLTATPEQIERVRETLSLLASQPPSAHRPPAGDRSEALPGG